MRLNTSTWFQLQVLLASIATASFSPKVSTNTFQGAPKDIVYFEDTPNVIYHDSVTEELYISLNDGESWEPVSSINSKTKQSGDKINQIIKHPFDKSKAYALTNDKTHFLTTNSGESWAPFSTLEDPAGKILASNVEDESPLAFNSLDSDLVLFAGSCVDKSESGSATCNRQFYYSKDNLGSYFKLTAAHSCLFANSASNLDSKVSKQNIICAIDTDTGLGLVSSDDFFQYTRYLVSKKGGMISGTELLGAADGYLLAMGGNFIKKDAKFVYISYNGADWEAFQLPPDASIASGIQLLESVSDSININVPKTSKTGQLLGDNSLGKLELRLDNLNQDSEGNLDYEALEGLAGVILSNVKDSSDNVQSKISFDNAHTWNSVKLDNCNSDSSECTIQLHHTVFKKISGLGSYLGKYYSSKTPGVLIGVGNTGKSLKKYADCDTFISTNGGVSWFKALTGPHVFEIGDSGSIIVAMDHSKSGSDKVVYSLDFGKTWNEVKLDQVYFPSLVTTTSDSTSMKFLIASKSSTIALDFNGVYSNYCKANDFEQWSITDQTSQSNCIMGKKQTYNRRKLNADCSVGSLYNEALATESDCSCSIDDYVCVEGYYLKNGKCIINKVLEEQIVKSQCTKGVRKYEIPSGLALKSGNSCVKGESSFEPLVRECPVTETVGLVIQRAEAGDEDDSDAQNPDEREGAPEDSKDGKNDGKVKTSLFTFKGTVKDYIYLEKKMDDESPDESLMALTSQNEVFVTHNQGSSWEEVAPDDEFLGIYLNKYNTDHVYLLATNDKIVYSRDRGDNWKSFRTPCKSIPGATPLYFHPERPSWMIYVGQEGCEDSYSQMCRTAAYITRSYGKRWLKLQENVDKCTFVGDLQKRADPKLVICEKQANEATGFKSSLIASRDDFNNEKIFLLENIVGYVQVENYLVAASVVGDNELRAHVSTNALDWNEAFFPPNFRVDKQQAYTTLSGATKSIFLHVTTNPRQNTEFGSILKSNSAGTSYVLTLENVNRDSNGYVDFEQMSGLGGVIVVNTVANAKEAKQGKRKQLKSMITHNDGAQWDYIQPPYLDAAGNKFACNGKSLKDCSLHLHGYTEREDYRDTFSSQSAVGMMIGIGNVGDKLENYYDGHTYLTKDGGLSWKEVKKGVYMWEYGDQGSVIVLVNGKDNTNTLSYSVDEGDTFVDFKFTDEEVTVQDISTVPSDNSLKFLLFTRVPLSRGDKTRVFQIDFSQLLSSKCNMDLTHPDIDDFELWTPKHPFQPDNCLFGHETQYYRKVPGKLCHVGKKLTQPFQVVRNCACTRQDYECDFNYYRDEDGICKLIPGQTPPSHADVCLVDDPPIEFFPATGYRKIPLSTCEGGKQFDRSSNPIPCKGKEGEFYREHPGKSWFAVLLISATVVGMFAFLGKFAYKIYQTKYGEIRLDDEGNFSMVENDGDILSQLKQFTGSTAVTVVALTSQAVKHTFMKAKDLQSMLKSRITGNRYSSVDAYTVPDEFDREQEVEEEQSLREQNSASYQDDEPLFSDDDQDLSTV